MTYDQIAALFRRVYNGERNFMTPSLITYGKRGRHLYEISSGKGISGTPLYGVTVIDIAGNRCPKLSTCFSSLERAQAYVHNDFVEEDDP